jgi:oligopeptide transport system substrate-binding protein
MKWFYIISLVIVALMVASPYSLIPFARRNDAQVNYTEVVIGYEDDGTPIIKTDPVVRFGSYGSTVSSLDPATCGDTTSSAVQTHCYEGLYTYHYLNRPSDILPLLAAELPTVSDDGLTYTIPIRKGVYFSRNECFGFDANGLPATREVTAHDFVLALKRVGDYHLANGALSQVLIGDRIVGFYDYRDLTEERDKNDTAHYDELDIEGVQALDDYTLQLKLTEPFPQLIYVLAMHNYAPIPHEVVSHYLADKTLPEIRDAEEVVSTGAYLLAKYDDKKPIVFVRNPEYRYMTYPTEGTEEDRLAGLLDDAGKQVPFIDIIHWDYVEEDFTGWQMFLSGEVDATGISEQLFDSVVKPNRELQEKWRARGIIMHVYGSPSIHWLGFNLNDPLFAASPSLRKAISLGIDVDNYIELLYNGRGVPAINCIPAALAESDPSSYEAHTQAGQGDYYRYDLDEAKQLLVQAKAELDAAGLLVNGNIPTLDIYIPGTDTSANNRGDFFAQQFRRMGLEANPHFNDWATHQEKIGSGIAQTYMMGWAADYPDAENFLQLFYSGNFHGEGDPPYQNERFDTLYETVRVMPDSDERTALYAEMTQIINEDCPVRFLSEPISFVLTYEWVKNFKPHPVGYGYAKYRRIDTDLRRSLNGKER